MAQIKIDGIIYGSGNASDIIYKNITVEEKLDTIPVFDINDNGNVENNNTDYLTYANILDNLNSTNTDKALSANQGKILNEKINTTNETVDNNFNTLSEVFETFKSSFLNLVYPIGAVYISINSTSPATLFGGTWEAINDRFLLSAGSSYSAGSTGGAATHTLTIAQMPAHTHGPLGTPGTSTYNTYQFQMVRDLSSSSTARVKIASGSNYYTTVANPSATDYGSIEDITAKSTTGSTGSGAAHNNMPPYLTVYMWKRVS